MTKRDAQLRDYVAEGRVYGSDGDRLTLTAEEREAIGYALQSVRLVGTEECFNTLRALLERTK